MPAKIHTTAIVHTDAIINDNVEIGPYTIIGAGVSIGSGTYVGPHCIIEFAKIGKNNTFTGSDFIGTPPQDFKYHGEPTSLEIGDGNIVREGVSLHRGSPLTGLTRIGSNCMFMANSHIGHDGRVGNGIIMVNSAAAAGHVEIGDKAVISGLVGIHQFARIGELCMLSGGAMVTQDIAPYCKAQGDRAKLVGLNLVGMRRSGISRENMQSVKLAYKTLFLSHLPLREALLKLRASRLSPEAEKMVVFCENSKRGLSRARMARKGSRTADENDE